MRIIMIHLLCFNLFFVAFGAFSKGLPIGKVGESAKSNKTIESTKINTCLNLFATPLGGFGSLNSENMIYSQVYLKSVGKVNSYVHEITDLKTLASTEKTTFKLEKIDHVVFSKPKQGYGLTMVIYDDNSDACYDGAGKLKIMSISEFGKAKLLTEKGMFSTFGLDNIQSLLDPKAGQIINFQYKPFVRKYVKISVPNNQRVLYAENSNLDEGYSSLINDGSKQFLMKSTANNPVALKFEIKSGDRIVRNRGEFALIRVSKDKKSLYFFEPPGMSRQNERKVFKFKIPNGITAKRFSVFHSSKIRTLFLAAGSNFSRKKWNDVWVINYQSGKLLSKLDLPKESIPGEIHFDSDGQVGVVEEVDSKSGIRKALHVFKLNKLIWKKI